MPESIFFGHRVDFALVLFFLASHGFVLVVREEFLNFVKKKEGWDGYGRVAEAKEIPKKLEIPAGALLNVSAYAPGDFKQFFNDPRTRADYLKWAPLLLVAEGSSQETRPTSRRSRQPSTPGASSSPGRGRDGSSLREARGRRHE
jgi:hypothetical protein